MFKARVFDLCEDGGWSGHAFRGRIAEDPDGNAKVVQLRDVAVHSGIAWDALVTTQLDTKKPPRWLQRGDVLFAARGMRFTAVCVDELPAPSVCAPHFFHLRVNPEQALPEFIAWQINQTPFQNNLNRLAEGTESATIRMSEFKKMKLVLPSLEKQQKLIELFTLQQQERQVLEQMIENNEQQMKAIAQALVGNNCKEKAANE